MSLSALLRAVRDELRTKLVLDSKECGIQDDGQPPPGAGQKYISVYARSWEPTQGPDVLAIEETYSIGVMITKRSPATPADRRTEDLYLRQLIGMEPLARQIMTIVHQSTIILDAANAILEAEHSVEANPLQPITSWLVWQGTDHKMTGRDGNWFWLEVDKAAGYTMEVRFGNADRPSANTYLE